jgi:hypothetical protein
MVNRKETVSHLADTAAVGLATVSAAAGYVGPGEVLAVRRSGLVLWPAVPACPLSPALPAIPSGLRELAPPPRGKPNARNLRKSVWPFSWGSLLVRVVCSGPGGGAGARRPGWGRLGCPAGPAWPVLHGAGELAWCASVLDTQFWAGPGAGVLLSGGSRARPAGGPAARNLLILMIAKTS